MRCLSGYDSVFYSILLHFFRFHVLFLILASPVARLSVREDSMGNSAVIDTAGVLQRIMIQHFRVPCWNVANRHATTVRFTKTSYAHSLGAQSFA